MSGAGGAGGTGGAGSNGGAKGASGASASKGGTKSGASKSSLGPGSTGPKVSAVQSALNKAGYPTKVDGKYGRATANAVKSFQHDNGLKATGRVDSKTLGALKGAVQGATRGIAARKPGAAVNAPPNKTARINSYQNPGKRNQMATGQLTINGHTYNFKSGGHAKGSLPTGDYKVSPHMWSRDTKGMTVGGVGYSFAMSDKYDARVGEVRDNLRIHPDGGSPGTSGCLGIVGNRATQEAFRNDMRAELNASGGSFTLSVN